MATEAANAERQDRARATINAHVERISKSIGVAAPPPVSKADGRAAQQANEAERLATFLSLVANHVDPSNAGKTYAATAGVPHVIGEYSAQEEEAKAGKGNRQGRGTPDTAVEEGDEADASPVSDSNADEAIEQIGRMRSRDKLQHIVDNDGRVSVKKAAQERLESL